MDWLFLTGRSQQVKYLNLISTPKLINRNIVQGSGIGPTLYIVKASRVARVVGKCGLAAYCIRFDLRGRRSERVGSY